MLPQIDYTSGMGARCLLVALAFVSVLVSGTARADAVDQPSESTQSESTQLESIQLVGDAAHLLAQLTTKDDAGDSRYYSSSGWQNKETASDCLRCDMGPAVLAATLGSRTGDEEALRMAIDSFDAVLSADLNPDGSVGQPAAGEGKPAIQTALFAAELGVAYLELEPYLDAPTAQRWKVAVAGAADWLWDDGDASWYANGNINLGVSLVMASAYKLTGDPKYQQRYESALRFAIEPSDPRWAGFGWQVTKAPTKLDASDGAGYFAEKGEGVPGFDADYTQMQADFAVQLHRVTDDPQALRLANMLVNRLLPLVDKSDWMLDTSGGSRHPQRNRQVYFSTGALHYLAVHGRADLAQYVPDQAAAQTAAFAEALQQRNPGMTYAFGSQLAVSVAATLPAGPVVAPPVDDSPPTAAQPSLLPAPVVDEADDRLRLVGLGIALLLAVGTGLLIVRRVFIRRVFVRGAPVYPRR